MASQVVSAKGFRSLALLFAATLALSGCDSMRDLFVGGNDKPKVQGERISVLAFDNQLEPDQSLKDQPVQLPRPWVNPDWPQSGGYPSHAMHHLALGDSLRQVWRADIGAAGDDEQRIIAQPLVAEGRVFTKDARANVSAFDANTGRRLWRIDLTPRDEDEGAIGGGLAYSDGKLFVATGYGDVVAVQPETGLVYWHVALMLPMRGAPGADGGRVYVVTNDNQLHTLDGNTGRELWTHSGIVETAGLIGAANPAVDGNTVIAPYSSGEVVALRADTGTPAWGEQLVRTAGRASSVGTINDIDAAPVVDRGRAYVISQSGRFVAVDMRTGERVWEKSIASTQTPWVAGEYIFVITNDSQIVCLMRRDGRVKWTRQLTRYEDPAARTRKGVITWYGPVLAGDRLLVASSTGLAYALSPYNGDLIGSIKMSGPATVSPVVAGGTVYLLTQDAVLSAWR